MDTVNKQMLLPSEIELCLSLLNQNGYSAYVVGGAVRDHLMGRQINDYDVCTDALPNEVEGVFHDYRVIETGIKHGTVTVLVGPSLVEITTFRTDGSYSDGRHPDSVDFTRDIVKDLSRRDFTVNAIAYSPIEGYIDPFCGIGDISSKVIRCVGDPTRRFSEDALRILRALRFSATLGFTINNETSNAIFTLKHNLSLVSKERVRDEIKKLICGKDMFRVMNDYRDIMALIIPDISATFDYNQNNPHHDFDLYTHILKTVSNLPCDPTLRFSGLLHDIAKPITESKDNNGISHFYAHAHHSAEMAEKILRDLRFSNVEIKRIVTLIRHHDGVIEETESAVGRKLSKIGQDMFLDLLDLQRADNASQKLDTSLRTEHNESLRKIANDILSKEPCLSLSDLALNGNDMIDMGYKGKEIGKALTLLFNAVLNGEVKNTKKDLSEYIRINFKN
ncbi:MAG: HD domain-containing protein [Ruminococcaceae bacterium]|nr:HD domain-containing protein [Oscillospiraceae bacterium]